MPMGEADLAVSANKVIQSPADKKQYRLLKLANGLTALLINDPTITLSEAAGSDAEDSGSGQNSEGSEEEDSLSDGSHSSSGSSEGGSNGEEEEGGRRAPAAATKKAAAALAVGVGSFSDPPDLQGLSHYLEHMLFMGSEKFPDENEYDAYLNAHGGGSNAYTELEYTNYHFDVQPAALRGALERFAQFFVAPLFRGDALEREVQAVDSEFVGVQQSDHARLSQLMCHTCKPGHVYGKFSWGNKCSLWDKPAAAGIDVAARLKQYYKQQYSAERMTLVVVGGQQLEELEGWVQELFQGVTQGLGTRPSFSEQGMPFEGCKLYLSSAVKDHHEVTVTFQLPCLRHLYRDKPEHYLSHLIGHEGPGSLLSCLKARGWATEIVAGTDDDGYSSNTCCYLFTVSINLTEAGLHAGPGFGLAPVALLMQYLKMLRQQAPQRWVWDELVSINDMKWRFQEEEEACELATRLAATLGWVEEPRHVLVADYLHEAWRPDVVLQLLGHMHPADSSYRIDLLTKAFPQLSTQLQQQSTGSSDAVAFPVVEQFTEPWFSMEAACVVVPEQLRRSWADADVSPELALPPPNPYLPSDFSLRTPPAAAGPAATADTGAVSAAAGKQKPAANGKRKRREPEEEAAQKGKAKAASSTPASAAAGCAGGTVEPVLGPPPTLVLDKPGCRLWHLLDGRFAQPRCQMLFRLSSPAAASTARQAALQHLWLKLLEEVLAEDSYLADMAGIHYSTSPEGLLGVELRVEGFSHKLPLLAQRVFSCLRLPPVKAEVLSAVHEALLRQYRNMQMQVVKAAAYSRVYALSTHMWHSSQVQQELEGISSVEVVQAYADSYLASCHLEALMVGNVTPQEATQLAQQLVQQLGGGCVLPAPQRPQELCTVVPQGGRLLHQEPTRNIEEDNSAMEMYLQVGPCSDLRLRVLNDLVDQVLYEPCYNTLRTKQQLGYTVHSGTRLTYGVLGYAIVVVSAAYGAVEVEQRVEAFLKEQVQVLKDMSAEEFQRHVSSLTSLKLQQEQSLGQEAQRLWEQVWSTRYDFTCREQEVALLQQLTLQDLQQYFEQYIAPGAPHRRQLVVHVVPHKAWQQREQQGGVGGASSAAAAAAAGAAAQVAVQLHEVAHVDAEPRHQAPVSHVADAAQLVEGARSNQEQQGPAPELLRCWRQLEELRQQLASWPSVSGTGGTQ